LFPLCQRRGVAVLAGGVFNSGILAGPGDNATYDYAPAPSGLLARAGRLRDACASYGIPLPAAALQFTLRHPAVTAAVVGAQRGGDHSRHLLPLHPHPRTGCGLSWTGPAGAEGSPGCCECSRPYSSTGSG
jgi:hypothetical protein